MITESTLKHVKSSPFSVCRVWCQISNKYRANAAETGNCPATEPQWKDEWKWLQTSYIYICHIYIYIYIWTNYLCDEPYCLACTLWLMTHTVYDNDSQHQTIILKKYSHVVRYYNADQGSTYYSLLTLIFILIIDLSLCDKFNGRKLRRTGRIRRWLNVYYKARSRLGPYTD